MELKAVSKSFFPLCLALASLFGCAQPAAHVGEAVDQAQLASGVNVTTAENRYLQDNGKIAGEDSSLVEVTAKVTDINKAKRVITLKRPDGELVTLRASDEVRNFNQVKKGDNVSVRYYLSVAFEVRQPTKEELELADSTLDVATRARLGEKPGMGIASGTLRILSVASIDKSAGTITVSDSAGKVSTLKAKYPQNLSYVKAGDSVVVTLTEALATGVTEIKK